MDRLITRVVFSLSLIFILTSTSAAQGDTVSVRTEQKTSTADVAETDSIAADTAMTAFAEAPEDFAPAADNGGIYNSIKVKFIEGNVGFMSLVALALIIGLTFCIERIIYLSLSEINTRKLLEDLEVKIMDGDIDGAKSICRETRGPVASICYQGLMRTDEPVENIERSIVSYGSVQSANLEKGCTWITLCIAIAPSLGFLGTVVGMVMAFEQIQTAGDISPTIVAAGMKVALITTIFGIIAALILQVFYNYILTKIEHITTQMEEAAISLLDIITKSRQAR
ncbi:MAG: MotA/TolQ/ExbB proton channel family protein [Prevotella sp.]|nr:MotA/TolQ/ExbB proton channel family protein [Prevotella sp.]MBS5527515.1 MotA/TolQ/ExbB proton channel family protein [Prevotella sp.]